MITTQIGSADIRFRTDMHIVSCATHICDFNRFIFSTDAKQSQELYSEVFYVGTCRYESRETVQQQIAINQNTFDQTVNGWIAYVKEQFYTVSQVESIYYTIDDIDIDVWLIIPTRNFNLLRRLIDLEIRVLDIFSTANLSLYRFEFHIIYRNNASEHQIVPKKALRLPR